MSTLFRRSKQIGPRILIFFYKEFLYHIVFYYQEVYCLEPEKSNDSHLEVISKRKLPTSKFSALIAEQQLYDVRSNSAADVFALNKDALGNNAIAQVIHYISF